MSAVDTRKHTRWRLPAFRFTLRTLFLVVTAFAIITSWTVCQYKRAREQADAVRQVRKLQGHVAYGYQLSADGGYKATPNPPGPKWLRERIGIDYFDHPVLIDFWETGYYVGDRKHEFECFADLHYVHTITCFDGPLGPLAIDYLEKMSRLRCLVLERCDFVTDEDIAGLRRLDHLEELRIIVGPPYDGFTDQGVKRLHLSRWSNLRLLVLGSPNMTANSIAEIRKAPNLEEFYFAYGTPIDDSAVPELAKLTSLQVLDVTWTSLTDEGVSQLRRHLTSCKVRHKRPW